MIVRHNISVPAEAGPMELKRPEQSGAESNFGNGGVVTESCLPSRYDSATHMDDGSGAGARVGTVDEL